MTTASGIWVPACAGTTAECMAREPTNSIPDNTSKLHLRRLLERLALLDANVKEILGCESKRARQQHRGELLDPGVVLLHRVIEEAAGGGDLVLQIRKLALQFAEVLAGLEVGIGFAQREQLPQCLSAGILGRGLRRHASRLRRNRGVARLHNCFKRAALVAGVP